MNRSEELAKEHSRSELDEIATKLGLNPKDYRTKSDIVEAIIEAETPVEGMEEISYNEEDGRYYCPDGQAFTKREQAIRHMEAET